MMKSVSLITRRDAITRGAFQNYYEQQHATLAMRYFPYQRYTRNHLSGDASPGFDCISEFGMTEDFRAYAGNVMESESRSRLLADELKFMQPERIRMALVEEVILQPTPVAGATPEAGQARCVLLFRAVKRPGDVAESMRERLLPLLQGSEGAESASLDIVHSDHQARFGFDALLWLALVDGPAADALLARLGQLDGLVHTLPVSTFATPLRELQDRFECYLP